MDQKNLANLVLNNFVNVDTILTVLVRKGLLTQAEFDTIKKERIEKLKEQFPDFSL